MRNKTIKIFLKYFFGPLLFVGLSFSIFQQIRHQPHLAQSWEQIKASFASVKIVYLFLACSLIFVNWGLESWKWKLLVSTVRPIGFWPAYKAVLSGVSFSVSLPNRVGEYIGRMMYQPEGGRLKTISLAIVGSVAQLLVTLFCGLISLVVLKKELLQLYPEAVIGYQFLVYGLLGATGLLAFAYFNVSAVVAFFSRWLSLHHLLYLVESLQKFNASFLARILLISSLRYVVFLLQYLAMFSLFGVAIAPGIAVSVMSVVFLALAVIPSIALVEVGLRGEVSLRLLGIFSANSLGIGLTSVTIWFINLIVPALLGTLFLLNVKLLSKNEETS
ncbi:lysylphosphatidylglycerol synthase domain-containing protein [Flavisolibacter nicotianae]|uniref:lysylphosphatidylglycerol synthase domain-containing protein n=1 Tax=Flavisolibacter nicotianae TaxID=2364882 RepID=UPI000EAF8E89|nr:lysylphosphatidylglycerol synthase domain-containing protein [Flavisolibacter nicotianae]